MSPLRLYGVAALDGSHGADDRPLVHGTRAISFRDLVAVASETPLARATLTVEELTAYRRAVEAIFVERAVLPAPAGVVFRTPDALSRWLELHYVALSEALAYVEGRSCARVHVSRALDEGSLSGERNTVEIGADADTMAAATFRLLRRRAVAMVPLRPPRESGLFAASASFLVERDHWAEFANVVTEEARRDPELRFRMTGPWPPYDFVKMSFGG